MKTYIHNKRIKPKQRIASLLVAALFGLSLSFGSFQVANAKSDDMGVVNANYVGWENAGDPDDYQRILLNATENDGGFLRIDRAPVTEEWTPELVDYWRDTWIEADVICTNVTDNVGVVVTEVTRVGTFPAGEGIPITLAELFMGFHMAFEFTDNGEGVLDSITQVMENPVIGGTHSLSEMLAMCDDGAIGDAGFEPFVDYHSGDIAIYQTDRKTFGEAEDFEAKYSIPADLDLLEDPGVINHGCEGGEYTLVDGKFTDSQSYTFYPNQAAFEASQPGSLLEVNLSGKYSGLWNSTGSPGSLYKLKDNLLGAQVYVWPDGTDYAHFGWMGEFIDVGTNLTTEWWNIDIATNGDGVASGTSDGTCGDIQSWDSSDGGEEESPLGVGADFVFNQSEANVASQIPWENQQIQADANNVDGSASFRWSDPGSENTFAETDVHCTQFGRSFAGEDDYVNFAGQIQYVEVGGVTDESLIGSWYFVQLGRGADEPEVPGEQTMHNAGIIDESQAIEMCLEVTPEEIPVEWQSVIVPQDNGYIQFFDIGDDGGHWGELVGMEADFSFMAGEEDLSFVPWQNRQVIAALSEGENNYIQWVDPADPENYYIYTDLHCGNVGSQGPVAFANFAGQISEVGPAVDGNGLLGEWFIVQIGYDLSDEPTDGAPYMHVGELTNEELARDLCEHLTPTIEDFPEIPIWQSYVFPNDTQIHFFEAE